MPVSGVWPVRIGFSVGIRWVWCPGLLTHPLDGSKPTPMKQKNMTRLAGFFLFTLSLSACKYSNEFRGSYNGQDATLSAYSKNVNKYCISLDLNSGEQSFKNGIDAGAVYDSGDFNRSKNFNTKGAECSGKYDEYLVGTRSTKILNSYPVSRIENVGIDMCQVVYYQEYLYQDLIQFELKKKSDDSTLGTFKGEGQSERYLDTSRPTGFGPVYFCGPGFPRGGYPYPYPYPFPGQFPGWGPIWR